VALVDAPCTSQFLTYRFLPSQKNEILVSLPERCGGHRANTSNVCAIGEALEIPEEIVPRVAVVLEEACCIDLQNARVLH
jgi:hypothetical protein